MFARSARRCVAVLGLLVVLCTMPYEERLRVHAGKDACAGRHDVAFATTADPATQRTVVAIACATSTVRGLTPRTPVAVRVVDAATLGAEVKQIMQKDLASSPITGTTITLQLLGALGPKDSLAAIRSTRYSINTAAQYDIDGKTLYVRASSGRFSPLDLAIIAHEYERALQDQYVGLAALLSNDSMPHNSDAQLARQALVEGDAFTTMLSYVAVSFDKHQVFQFNQQLQRSANAANDFLHDQIGFPATEGTAFVNAVKAAAAKGKHGTAAQQAAGNQAVNQAMRDPPTSTAEVLNPVLYLQHHGTTAQSMPAPTVNMGSQWEEVDSDVLGAFGIGDLLAQRVEQHSATAQAAAQAAATWQGDRWVLYRRGEYAVIVWRAHFSSTPDALSFVRALVGYTAARFHATLNAQPHMDWHTTGYCMSIRQRGTDVAVAIGSNQDLLSQMGKALTSLGFS